MKYLITMYYEKHGRCYYLNTSGGWTFDIDSAQRFTKEETEVQLPVHYKIIFAPECKKNCLEKLKELK